MSDFEFVFQYLIVYGIYLPKKPEKLQTLGKNYQIYQRKKKFVTIL